MKISNLIERFQKMNGEAENPKFKKSTARVIALLEQIKGKDITDEEKQNILAKISPFLENVQTSEELKEGLKKLKKLLTRDFGFVPANHYLSLGVGLGLALGTSLGISLGASFDRGIVFGPMVGSGIGLIVGLIVGMFMDKQKESENRTLKNL